jgi:hypothetical protein
MHLPEFVHVLGEQFMGHLLKAQSIVLLVEVSGHEPPFVAGVITLVWSCFPDKVVAEVSHVCPPEFMAQLPEFVHVLGTQFVGQPGKEQGTVLVVAEFAIEHVPPLIGGAIVLICV